MKKLLAAAIAALSVLFIPVAVHAEAATTCSLPCTTILNDGGKLLYMGVPGPTEKNAPIIAEPSANGREGWLPLPTGTTGVYTFEYDPSGSPSGYCISSPEFTQAEPLVLRVCATGPNIWQDIEPEYMGAEGYILSWPGSGLASTDAATLDDVQGSAFVTINNEVSAYSLFLLNP